MNLNLFTQHVLKIHRSGVLTQRSLAVTRPVPRATAAVSAHALCTPCNRAPVYSFIRSRIRRVHVILAVTCHLHILGRMTGILFRATPVTRGCSDELGINLAAQFWTCQMESFHRVQWESGEAELENFSRNNKDHGEMREAQGSESKIVLHIFFFLHSISNYKGQIAHTYTRARARAHTHTHTHTHTHLSLIHI